MRSYKRLLTTFLSMFGFIWLFFEPAGLFFPDQVNFGLAGYVILVVLSFVVAIIVNRPRQSFSRQLSSPDSIIAIKVGDLFEEPKNLVIGANDVFDTELGDVIKPESVQGQFLTRVFHGDVQRLDKDIEDALLQQNLSKTKAAAKIRGKSWRYPIGTTIVLRGGNKRYFLCAYGYMGNDLRVTSTVDAIWKSLMVLWEQVRRYGHGDEVSMPVIGSALARTNLSRMTLIKLIVISFIAASKEGFVSEKLTIVIHPRDRGLVDLYELEDFLNSKDFLLEA